MAGNLPDRIWIEETQNDKGEWVESRRWSKPGTLPFDPERRRKYLDMMKERGSPKRFQLGKVRWELVDW